jgi:hypothetical protein
VPKDAVEGVKWLRKAAEQNLALAQHNLGFCYFQGQGVAKDAAEAVKWWRLAAGQNSAEAQFNLGACYANGQGVVKDAVEAYKWMLLAAEQGIKTAKEYLPDVGRQLSPAQLAEGRKRASEFKLSVVPSLDVQQGTSDATPLADLRAKAESGDASAQNQLGLRYQRGDGTTKNEVEACKWYLLAAAQGDTKAKRNVSMLELRLSKEQMAEGKRRAQDWLEQRKKPSTNNR